MKRNGTLILSVLLVLFVFFFGWRAHAQRQQSEPSSIPQRQWEYNYDTASRSFPTEADKTKINLYAINRWELITIYGEGNQTVLVFRRLRQSNK